MIPSVKISKIRFSIFLLGVLAFALIACNDREDEKEYFISYQEVKKNIDSGQNISGKKNSDLIIELSNNIDTVFVSILKSKTKTVRKNKKNVGHYTSFTSLDSLIKKLKEYKFDSLPVVNEGMKPKIFFVDSITDRNLIKLIPIKQIYQTSKDDFDRFQ